LSLAMARCMDADIYLIDDGLSAQDAIYHAKVKAKFAEILDRNRTLIFASNNLRELSHYCRRALWLEGGKLVADGNIEVIVESYLAHRQQPPQAATQDAPQNTTSELVDTESHAPNAAQTVTMIDAYRRELKRAK